MINGCLLIPNANNRIDDDAQSSSNISQFFRSSKVSHHQKKILDMSGNFLSTIIQDPKK